MASRNYHQLFTLHRKLLEQVPTSLNQITGSIFTTHRIQVNDQPCPGDHLPSCSSRLETKVRANWQNISAKRQNIVLQVLTIRNSQKISILLPLNTRYGACHCFTCRSVRKTRNILSFPSKHHWWRKNCFCEEFLSVQKWERGIGGRNNAHQFYSGWFSKYSSPCFVCPRKVI